jgi:hypothetical protein
MLLISPVSTSKVANVTTTTDYLNLLLASGHQHEPALLTAPVLFHLLLESLNVLLLPLQLPLLL